MNMKKRIYLCAAVCCLGIWLAGCGKAADAPQEGKKTVEEMPAAEDGQLENPAEKQQESREQPEKVPAVKEEEKPAENPAAEEAEAQTAGGASAEELSKESVSGGQSEEGRLIVIDAGHQRKGNPEREPIGPNAAQTKAKTSSGTRGRTSGVPEYELNLQVSLKLKEELLRRGYRVLMVRETHDVNISNSERAAIANDAEADVFIRIHANGSEDPGVNGILTICPTKKNPYCPEIYEDSSRLAANLLDSVTAATGARKRRVWETDTMSGINWCKVPVAIVEMGYMTNKEEDLKLVDSAYQDKLVTGMADGIDLYFLGQ